MNHKYLTNMSYLQRSCIDDPLKISQKVNKMQIPNSSYLKSFKKTISSNNNHPKLKTQSSHRSNTHDENARQHQQRSTEKSMGQPRNKNQFEHLHHVMQETDNSMEELLNSSINHFEKLIINEESGETLEEQNHRLKNALYKMKNILRDKLEVALQKQKEELSKMLEDYISLITKLLQDKEQLTVKIQDLAQDNHRKFKELEMDYTRKLNLINEEREEQIGSTKLQIEEFLTIIEQYEEEARQEQLKFSEMQDRITELEEEKQTLLRSRSEKEVGQFNEEEEISIRLQAQSTKIQTLLELLEKNQQENNELKAEIIQLRRENSGRDGNELRLVKEAYERRIQELQQEHEEEFLEYEKAIKDTLAKKEECIERLNLIIENLRERKSVHS